MVPDPPVSGLVQLLDGGGRLGGEEHVVCVEPCAAEPKCQLQELCEVLVQFGSAAGVSGTDDIPGQGKSSVGVSSLERVGRA